eukprot:TRINITY_DN10098_c0_g1_i1.p1 TRINITY_DN10098_c0_g1~~TRINITY_DN10098_c0_g1_i1.p1  ORF type:complete len:142 (+),score=37.15 TRINITY_DN10098_c0_g1_i1:37-462(+)
MAGTGVGVAEELFELWDQFKLGHNHKFMTIKLSDDGANMVPDAVGGPDDTYDDFLQVLPKDDCRYGIVYVKYVTDDGGDREKIVFVLWSPDSSRIKSKMIYAGTKDTVKTSLQGLNIEIQASDLGEADKEEAVNKCKSISR